MDEHGPVMLAATAVLRGQKTRVGKIGGNITLPRTVPLESLVAGAIGAFIGLFVGAIVNPSLDGFLYGAVFGISGGVFLVTYSPLRGESMLTWLNLAVAARRNRVTIDGKPVRLAVGICYISRAAAGEVRIVRGSVPVPASQYDERGVPISARNMNLPDELRFEKLRGRDLLKGAALPDESTPLPENSPDPVTSKKGKKVLEKDKEAGKGRKSKRLVPGQAPSATQLGEYDPSRPAPVSASAPRNRMVAESTSFPTVPVEVPPAPAAPSWVPTPDPNGTGGADAPFGQAPVPVSVSAPEVPVSAPEVPGMPYALPVQEVPTLPVQGGYVPDQGAVPVPAAGVVDPATMPGNLAARRAAQRAAGGESGANPLDTKPKKLPKEKKR